MAKKAKKKAKVGKAKGKAAKKGAAKKGGVKKKASAKKAANPAPVTTGKGASPMELGKTLVAHFNEHKPDAELWARHFSPKIVSVEGIGMAMAWSGMKALKAKAEDFYAKNTVHGATAEGPYVGATGFAVKYRVDMECKATGTRNVMEEVGVYTVQNGKIVREEFMYGT